MTHEDLKRDFDELKRILNVPFFFWVCPKGCRGRVCWHPAEDGGARAECLECGQWSEYYGSRDAATPPAADADPPDPDILGLPLSKMVDDAMVVIQRRDAGRAISDEAAGDLAAHVLALAEEVKRLSKEGSVKA